MTDSGKLKNSFLAGAACLWALLVFIHYYHPRAALDLSFLGRMFSGFSGMKPGLMYLNGLGFLGTFACAGSAWLVLWRLGRRLFQWMGPAEAGGPLRFCLETAFGILALDGLWLGTGFNGLWFKALWVPAGAALLAFALWDFWRDPPAAGILPSLRAPKGVFALLALLGAFSLGLSFLQALAPDVYFDALVYHLSTLRFWEFHHGLADFSTNLYSCFPFGGELYFMDGFYFGGSQAAKMMNVLAAGLLALAAGGWAAEEGGRNLGWTAWAMVLTFPLVSAVVWTTQNDAVLALLLVLFLYALSRWVTGRGGTAWALAAGLLGGGALSVKDTAAVGMVPALLGAGIFLKGFRRDRMRGWAWMAALACLCWFPWILKDLCFRGDGFYPYPFSPLGWKGLDPARLSALLGDQERVGGPGFTWGGWLSRLVGREMDKADAPLLVSFLPFCFLGSWRRPARLFLAGTGLFCLAGSFLVSYQPRLALPSFIVLFIAMAAGLGEARPLGTAKAWAWTAAFFGLLSLLSLGRLNTDYYGSYRVWMGNESPREYLVRSPQTRSYMGLALAAGRVLGPDETLLVVGDARGLYYPRPFYTNSVFDPQVLPELARRAKDGNGIADGLRRLGVEDLAVSGLEGARLSRQYPDYRLDREEWAKVDDFIQHRTDLVYGEGLNAIYRLRGPAARKNRIPDLLRVFQSPSGDPEKVF
jgi:Dolichyl-phosphate-mannose-protein mannosyltransferase